MIGARAARRHRGRRRERGRGERRARGRIAGRLAVRVGAIEIGRRDAVDARRAPGDGLAVAQGLVARGLEQRAVRREGRERRHPALRVIGVLRARAPGHVRAFDERRRRARERRAARADQPRGHEQLARARARQRERQRRRAARHRHAQRLRQRGAARRLEAHGEEALALEIGQRAGHLGRQREPARGGPERHGARVGQDDHLGRRERRRVADRSRDVERIGIAGLAGAMRGHALGREDPRRGRDLERLHPRVGAHVDRGERRHRQHDPDRPGRAVELEARPDRRPLGRRRDRDALLDRRLAGPGEERAGRLRAPGERCRGEGPEEGERERAAKHGGPVRKRHAALARAGAWPAARRRGRRGENGRSRRAGATLREEIRAGRDQSSITITMSSGWRWQWTRSPACTASCPELSFATTAMSLSPASVLRRS